jgi:hypothetical protein
MAAILVAASNQSAPTSGDFLSVMKSATQTVTKSQNPARPRYDMQSYNQDIWNVGIDGSDAILLDRTTETTFVVHKTNINKALHFLAPHNIRDSVTAKACGCRKHCGLGFAYTSVQDVRATMLRQPANVAKTVTRTKLLGMVVSGKQTYTFMGKQVCQGYWAEVHMISPNTLRTRVRENRANNVIFLPHGNCGKTYETTHRKGERCHAFWKQFFDKQAPGWDGHRYWPPESTHKSLFAQEFHEFWTDMKYPGEKPSLSTFFRATKHVDFKDVRRRKNHHHVKCTMCHGLRKKQRNDQSMTREQTLHFKAMYDAHNADVSAWRKLETDLMSDAMLSPNTVNLWMYDDTTALGFPHHGSRDYKGLANKYRLKVTHDLTHPSHAQPSLAKPTGTK